MKNNHLQPVIKLINDVPVSQPKSWKLLGQFALAGTQAVGFANNSDYLLVVSSNGRGLFDCQKGEKIARDYEDIDDYYDHIALEAKGIGHLENEVIKMSGRHGGGLPNYTHDGWSIKCFEVKFGVKTLTLSSHNSWGAYGVLYDKPHDFEKIYEDFDVVAWGFSPTGKTLIIADSSDLRIYGRLD